MSEGVRLQKIIADAGVASRRAAERLIAQGHVSINGKTVTEMGVRVDPEKDVVRVDGKQVRAAPAHRYVMLHKPRQVMTTADDPEGRTTVFDLLPKMRVRLFPVGRLDYDAEGLLLLTNDGELAHRLAHPRFGVRKIYEVKVKGHPGEGALEHLRRGVKLGEGVTAPAKVRLLKDAHTMAWIKMEIHQGWYRQIRRMTEAVGHPAQRIRRIGYGTLRLRSLKPGMFRDLTPKEVAELRRAVGLPAHGA